MKAGKLTATVLAFVFLFCGAAFADTGLGGGGVTVHRTFYVPYMPGAERPYGAYRMIAHTGDYNVSVVKGSLDYSTGGMSNDQDITDVFQSADLLRSDLVILTKLGLKVTDVKHSGDTTYYDTIYYETPEYVIGYFADISPLAGSMVMEAQKQPYVVASRISSLVSLFSGATEQEILKSLINYQGANPQGKRISLGGHRYVVSQKPDRMLFNWWQELSQEFLAENMISVQSFDWQEIEGYYMESEYKNGKTVSLPVYQAKFSDFPSTTEMLKLWNSKRGVLGKSTLPAHFTDYMTPLSPGTWVSSTATFTSCDPELLLRWLYKIPQKEGKPKVQVSTRIPTDFTAFRVDKELYDKLVLSDPNVFFAFAPFDDKAFDAKSGVKIFFPYEERYRGSNTVMEDLGETKSSISTLSGELKELYEDLEEEEIEEIVKEAQKAGSGKFSGNVESRYYSIAGCYLLPTEKEAATDMLKKLGFEQALKTIGAIP